MFSDALERLVALVFVVIPIGSGAGGHEVNGKVCVVNDLGGNPLNASAAEGTKAARSKLHVDTETLDADTEAEIIANIDAFVTAGDCDLIFGIGFIVGSLMEPFIFANPGQDFVVVDTVVSALPNVAQVEFLSNEAGFLAGYVAAGISETGKVGVFGGLPVPPVTVFMDGYALGVQWFNSENGASVEVLGWDPDLQTGPFTFSFDPADGQAAASDL
jgi:basic membrane protein A